MATAEPTSDLRFDRIGYWSELKLEIVRKYAAAYSRILASQRPRSFHHVYIDGFSGAGIHLSDASGEAVPGSPLVALDVQPPFREYYLIDLDGKKVGHLRALIGPRSDVHIFEGDCNQILLEQVFPRVHYEEYRRGLCLLDPYGLHLDWRVIARAGELRTLDLFINFPVMDINRNVLWRDREAVSAASVARMTTFWGDESWQRIAYQPPRQGGLFGELEPEKQPNEVVAAAFRQRLKDVAGFAQVAEPLPMRNRNGAIVYYLFFASQKVVAGDIIRDIFARYRTRRD